MDMGPTLNRLNKRRFGDKSWLYNKSSYEINLRIK